MSTIKAMNENLEQPKTKTPLKQRWVDLFIVSIISISPIISLVILKLEHFYGFLILGAVFLFATIPYKNNLGLFTIITAISVFASNVILTLLWGGAAGYILIFYLVVSSYILVGALVGLIFVKTYYFVLGNRVLAPVNKRILTIFFLIVFISLGSLIINMEKGGAKSSNETQKKSEFIKKIAVAIGKNEITKFTNKELISLGIPSGIYEHEGERIIHGYGGDFSIEKLGQDVHLSYEDIPAKESCYRFYFINDPDIYGFGETRVDNLVESYPGRENTSSEIDAFKNKACYSGKETVTIEFIGSIEDIVKNSEYWME